MSRVVRSSPPRSRRPLPNWAFSSSGIARPTSPTSGVSSMSPIGRSVRLGARARSRSTTTRWLTSGKQASTTWPPTGTRPVTTTQPRRRAGSVGRTASVRARRRTSGVRGSVGACVASGSRGRGRAVPSQAGATAVRRMSTTPTGRCPNGVAAGAAGTAGSAARVPGAEAGREVTPGLVPEPGAVPLPWPGVEPEPEPLPAIRRRRRCRRPRRPRRSRWGSARGGGSGGRAAGGRPRPARGRGRGRCRGLRHRRRPGGPPPSAPRRRRRHLRSTGGWHRVPQETPTVADRPRNGACRRRGAAGSGAARDQHESRFGAENGWP